MIVLREADLKMRDISGDTWARNATQRLVDMTDPAFRDFWAMPYRDLVELVSETARGGTAGAKYGLGTDIVTDVPGIEVAAGPARYDLLAKKMLCMRHMNFKGLQEYCQTDPDAIRERIKLTGFEKLDAAIASGRPVCMVGSHVGCAQLASYALSQLGYGVTHVGVKNLIQLLDLPGYDTPNFISVRGFQLAVVSECITALRSRRVLMILADGRHGGKPEARPFLGRMHAWQFGFAFMVAKTNALALPLQGFFDAYGRPEVVIHDPLEGAAEGATDGEQAEALQRAYRKHLEWIWVNRFGNIGDVRVRQHMARPRTPAQGEA